MSEFETPQAPEHLARMDEANDEGHAKMKAQGDDMKSERDEGDDTAGHKYGPPIRGGL